MTNQSHHTKHHTHNGWGWKAAGARGWRSHAAAHPQRFFSYDKTSISDRVRHPACPTRCMQTCLSCVCDFAHIEMMYLYDPACIHSYTALIPKLRCMCHITRTVGVLVSYHDDSIVQQSSGSITSSRQRPTMRMSDCVLNQVGRPPHALTRLWHACWHDLWQT